MRGMLVGQYGDEIGLFLAKRVGTMVRRAGAADNCMSDFRIADASIGEEMVLYESVRDSGCCASVDRRIDHYKSGRVFFVGFNWGH